MAEIAEIEDTLIEKSVFIDRTRIYFDRVSSGSKFGPISACLLAYSQSAIVDFKWLLAWGAMTVFFDVAISIVAMRFRALDTPPSNPSPWLWVSFVLGGCVGASWGASFWIFASEAHFEYYLYNLAFLAGVSMASIGAITPFRAGAVAYMTGILGIPLLRVLIVPPPQAFVVAASLVLLALIQWRYAQQSMNELLGNLRSTARNVHLAKLLAGANARQAETSQLLEEKNQELSQALDRLKQLFIRDDITGAYNRRYIFEQLERESTIFARHGHPVSIIMFDIDHFKKINDTFGHHTGDEVLRLTAQKLRSEIREIDLLARVGGEEFMILLPMQTHDVATSLAERLRVSLAAEPLLIDDQEISVTASFGCAQLLPEQDIPAWYKAADAAMYLAKKQGRNLVVNANTQGLAQR